MRQEYKTWVVIDPELKDWKATVGESIQNAAETAVLDYDSRDDVDFALAKETVIIQVLVQDPGSPGKAWSHDITCTMNPFYEITSPAAFITLD